MNKTKNSLIIAIAVITLELLGGMQSYLGQLIMPIMATDLHARGFYGVMKGVSTIASMGGLPFAAMLMKRVRLPRLLMSATMVLIVGAVINATAPNIGIYLIGSVISALSGTVLAMTSIGAVALGLQGRARQLTFAFSSASWVVASIVGPSYAAWVTHLLSWRWAMLMYLPLLLVARFVIAANLKDMNSHKDEPFSYQASFLIVVSMLITMIPATGIVKTFLLIAGALVMSRVVVIMMPQHTFRASSSRRAALAGMFFLTGGYFSANSLIGLTAHDVFGENPAALGAIIMGGGLGWALIGVYCGFRPASTRKRYRLRSQLGLSCIIAAAIFMAAWTLGKWNLPFNMLVLLAVWSVAGIGMGLTYLDTMNIFFDEPQEPDGISTEEMASASVIVESLASTMFVPLVASLVSTAFTQGQAFSALPYGASWCIVAALALAALAYLSHAAPTSNK